jgi:hypothetical protein
MTPGERSGAFGEFDPAEHATEAAFRWGDTDAYVESGRRTSAYTIEDWERLKAEADEINRGLLVLMQAGMPADSADAALVVDAHRAHITKWFYECTPKIHAGLGAMYIADERFLVNIDQDGEGLAAYFSSAIAARYGG